LQALYGREVRDFDCLTGWEDELKPTVEKEFSPVHEYTKLIPSLPGIDPDDSFCKIPYEKGSAFLLYLEQQLGSEEHFEQMLRDYIKKYRRQSVTTDMWIDFLKISFPDKKDVLDKINFDGWLKKPVSTDEFVNVIQCFRECRQTSPCSTSNWSRSSRSWQSSGRSCRLMI
jgi:leukotriene-A4 hydrolase